MSCLFRQSCIIFDALGRVGQNPVSFADILKSVAVPMVFVRMIDSGQLVVRLFDIRRVCIRLHPEYLIEVATHGYYLPRHVAVLQKLSNTVMFLFSQAYNKKIDIFVNSNRKIRSCGQR